MNKDTSSTPDVGNNITEETVSEITSETVPTFEEGLKALRELDRAPKYLIEAALLMENSTFDPNGPGLRERIFVIAGSDSIFGCLISETFDSFLVVLPTIISVDETGIPKGNLSPSNSRIIRLLKSSVKSMLIPDSQRRYFYIKYLTEKYEFMPDFFTDEKKEYIEYWVKDFEKNNPEKTRLDIEGLMSGKEGEVVMGVDWEMPEDAGENAFQYIYPHRTKQ